MDELVSRGEVRRGLTSVPRASESRVWEGRYARSNCKLPSSASDISKPPIKAMLESLNLVCDSEELLEYILKQHKRTRRLRSGNQQSLRDHLAAELFPLAVAELPLPEFEGGTSNKRVLAFVTKFCLLFTLCPHGKGNLAMDVDWELTRRCLCETVSARSITRMRITTALP